MQKPPDPKTALFEASRSMTAAIRILRTPFNPYADGRDFLPDRVSEAIAYLKNRRDVTEAAAREIQTSPDPYLTPAADPE